MGWLGGGVYLINTIKMPSKGLIAEVHPLNFVDPNFCPKLGQIYLTVSGPVFAEQVIAILREADVALAQG
jgi:hypothetical protein